MKPTITNSDGQVLQAHIEARCLSTGDTRSIRLCQNYDRLNIQAPCTKFGIDLTAEQACDLGTALITWAKTGMLEAGDGRA